MQFVRINDSNSQQIQMIPQQQQKNDQEQVTPQNAAAEYQEVLQNIIQMQENEEQNPHKHKKIDKEEKKERNRIAAKKWRDKKDGSLYSLEAVNDNLREQALGLRKQAIALVSENQILENELRFFQSFMTRIMNAPKR